MEFYESNTRPITVRRIVEEDLCTMCGTCVSLCPQGAIELARDLKHGTYIPQINADSCSHCETCFVVCPGHSLNFRKLNMDIFGRRLENTLESSLLGNFDSFYVGHSTDPEIRLNSASGGLVTELLAFALQEGMIDGALVTRMNRERPLEPEPFLATTKAELVESSQSKYCPVPANVALRQILDRDGKFAVVGLPCHIHGIRKAEQFDRKLKGKIALHIGIFCGGSHSFLATQVLLQRLNIRTEEVASINYRGNGWPGSISIETKQGRRVRVSFIRYYDALFSARFFRPARCNLCVDGVNELADISFGDAWLPEYRKTEHIGQSLFIVRNSLGREIVHDALLSGRIEIQEIGLEKVMQSTMSMLKTKKTGVDMSVATRLRHKSLNMTAKLVKSRNLAFLDSVLQFVNSCIGNSGFGRKLLVYAPLFVLKLYLLALSGVSIVLHPMKNRSIEEVCM